MFCYRSKVNGRLLEWAMPDEEDKKAPLLFANKQDGEEFGKRVIKARRKEWRLEQTEKLQPCWVYEGLKDGEGQYHWEGSVKTKDLKWKIRHPEGLGELEKECKEVYELVGKYTCPSYEKWELGFMYDENPDKELALWRQIGDDHRRYMADHPDADPTNVALLLASISVGSSDPETEPVRPYYTGPIKPLALEKPTPEEMQFIAHPNLAAAVPKEELRKLVGEWTEKAMHKECDTEKVVVWTQYGEVVILWDWEKKEILATLKADLPDQ